ncbi:L-erythrulose-4-phosphate epimerase [Arthrobacter sp. Bi83]|uniref:triose-phosphate isomerase family protein n=1 Tax=Arthrobacter sp. Bi83 TaxID=2822353 RepID=UPI001D405190|nr:triose-phosphate isomerase family protein [Arthrobacter sp. Bi83]CAH0283084.1 L-erythrulose-4-phosphate epimerase [Arthrobacter sp. Bi83]
MTQPSPAGPADRTGSDTIFVGVSTKMYLGYRDSLRWLGELRQEVDARPALAAGRVVPFVIPSFPLLPAAADILAGSPALLGAQDCGWADGPWTGEVSPSLLAELGVSLVEIGHAERRRYFGEDNAMVALKVRAADDAGITPLLCVGEGAEGPASGTNGGPGGLGSVSDDEPGSASASESAAAFVYRQIQAAAGGDWDLASRLVIAYEPVWAIGAAEPAGAEYVTAVVRSLRTLLAGHRQQSGRTLSDIPIIYGGSAKPGLLPTLDGVSGLFLGRFAHDAANFGKVLDEALALSEALDSSETPAPKTR